MRKGIPFMHVSPDDFVAGPTGGMNWIKVDEYFLGRICRLLSKLRCTFMGDRLESSI